MVKKNFSIIIYRGAPRGSDVIDIRKRWYIECTTIDRDGKSYRKPFYISNRLKTVQEREREITRLLREFKTSGPSPKKVKTPEHPLTGALKSKYAYVGEKGRMDYSGKVRIFLEWIENKEVKMIAYNDAVNFVNHLREQQKTNTTINNYITTLKTIFKVLVKTGKIRKNPFDGIDKLKRHRKSLSRYRESEIPLLRKELKKDAQLWLAVQFTYYCFIRSTSEMRRLKIGNIDFSEGTMEVPSSISKNKDLSHVVIPKPFLEYLISMELHKCNPNDYIFGNQGLPGLFQIGTNTLYNRHRLILKKLGFPKGYSIYSWKHTGVWFAVKANITMKELQMQLRHHSLDMVNEYLKNLGVMDMPNISEKFPAI
jgi:integrase